ncbi:MAG: preprotein translocase subunit SecY, partial [Gemmatimonadales bacterium]|nr:preprotein translocase subunit SecY [Gemmatimonadales bacterium]NIN12783.1 preprotein translocase subunit SecY [Gemmatimonadales bacterium]NIN51007.1 preprotein translocase subunit SecY [Gemmatimonadales bacterium]NIP08471.1 preprotein translocase subunit SecY [Gemmatimonadales bacterium]NIR02191.1 preprotein translocase subunit SecY [Gemmatimonadales bacterium]
MTVPRIPNLFAVPELKEKLLFTLLCLAIYRAGAHIATPGVDVQVLADFIRNQGAGTLFGIYDMFVGGGLSRATVLALGIMPYISASIMFQLAGAVFPYIEKLQKEEEGRKKITQWTRYATVLLSMFQAYGFAIFAEGQGAVPDPGPGFRVMTVLTLTTGAIFVMWLGERITERGIGNGMSLMIFFSIMEGFLPGTGLTLQFLNTNVITWQSLIVLLAVMLAVVAGVIAVTVAARRIPIQIPRKVMGRGRIREGQKTFIPIRINSAGVMPIIFAQAIIVVPGTIATFSNLPALSAMTEMFNPGSTVYYVSYALLIIFFTYFYTSIIFNPLDIAENLKKQGGFIPGVKPGAATADYIDQVLTRVTLPGSMFLTIIALLPFFIFDAFNVPFRFGGTALLIVVGVALDTWIQVQQH